MRSAGKASKQARKVVLGPLRKPRSVLFVTVVAFVLPGGGQVLNGDAFRGFIMQFAMAGLGFITWQLTDPSISIPGRLAGGLLLYVFSIVDANGIAKRRNNAWARMHPVDSPPRLARPQGQGNA
jgi:hypothetical protein